MSRRKRKRKPGAERNGTTSNKTHVKSFTLRDPRWSLAKAGLRENELDRPYAQNGWIYSAVRNKALAIAGVPLRLYTGSTKEPKLIEEGDLYAKLKRPNPHNNRYQLIEATVTHLELSGNAIWLMDREDPGRPPDEIGVFNHHWFRPIFDKAKRNSELLGWALRIPGREPIGLAPWQAVHMHYINPYGGFWGMAPLEVALAPARADFLATKYNQTFFENGATFGGYLSAQDPLTEEQYQRILAQIDDRHAGGDKAFRLLLTEGGITYQPTGQTFSEMAFPELRKMSREEIGAIFNVPPHWMGIFEQVHKAAGDGADRNTWEKALIPIMTLVEEALAAQFFIPYDNETTWVTFDLSKVKALQEDYNARVERTAKLQPMGVPFDHLNETFDLGIEAFPGSDVGFMPGGMLPIDSPMRTNPFGVPTPEDEPEDDDDEKGLTKRFPLIRTSAKAVAPYSPEHHAVRAQWKGALRPIESRFNGALRTYLHKMRKWFFARVEEAEEVYTAPESVPAEWFEPVEKWQANNVQLRKVGHRYYKETTYAMQPLINSHLANVGLSFAWTPADPRILQFLAVKEIKIVGVNDTIKGHVRNALLKTTKEGGDMRVLHDAISGVMDGARGRSLNIARTETAQAANGVEHTVDVMAGVQKHQWIATLDKNTRESHINMMQLGPWPLGEPFPNGCRHPGDMRCSDASEVVNCRCNAIPVE